jgi:catechol 2,3-dioxygenase-like lactoylglutathione lyase family enzyme
MLRGFAGVIRSPADEHGIWELCDPASPVLRKRRQAVQDLMDDIDQGETAAHRERSVFRIRIETCMIHENLYNPCMRRIPWSTIALGSLLLISVCSKGQEVQSPQPEKSKPPVKMEQRGRILGIGGVFFKSANRDQMREWYSKHLGLDDKGQGVMLPWREHDDPQKEHVTVWTVFPASTDYFNPSHAPFMVNYIVDDLDALLDRLKQEGVKIDAQRMNESYGRFAWIYDLDGNKIELWQPSAKP